MKFSEVELLPVLKAAVDKLGYQDLTPIQEATFPYILSGQDVAGLAQTGTGKTAAFLIPLMQRVLVSKDPRDEQQGLAQASETQSGLEPPRQAQPSFEPPAVTQPVLGQPVSAGSKTKPFENWQKRDFILIMVPTRELCEQVYKNFLDLKGGSGLRATTIYGGISYDQQKRELADPVEFIIATPGRLIDFYKDHMIDFRKVRAVVFDEADRMFDMGFKEDVRYVVQRIPRDRQVLLFSATLNFEVLNVAYEMGSNPIEVNLSRDQFKAENVRDIIYHLGQQEKPMYLISLLKKHNPKQVIIFSNYKDYIERIVNFLTANELPALGISSLLSQNQRNRVMEQFRAPDNNMNLLVATDLAARGLDIAGVDLVINFDLPEDPETYVHRIGRTGRAGQPGVAISLVSDNDIDALQRIENFLKHKLTSEWLEEADLVKDFKPFPNERVRRSGQSRWTRAFQPKRRKPDDRRNRRDRSSRNRQPLEETRSTGGRPAHRDRLLGRHGRQDNRLSEFFEQHRRQPSHGNRRWSHKGQKLQRPESRKTSSVGLKTSESKTFGQKIRSFFSKLFK